MRFYKGTNVFEEALDRIRFLFDEFEEIYINISGGKDSTVVYNLAKIVAKERNRMPLKVMFLDQEAEYEHTIEYMRTIMYSDDVIPYWVQAPIKLFNATSNKTEWLMCWEEGGEWLREKESIAIKENTYGTDRFHQFFTNFLKKESNGKKACYIAGVRAEESPSRFMGLTGSVCYKYVTWGKIIGKDLYTFYPIYDWSYTDVWKSICQNKWEYNDIYNLQYQYGIGVNDMRVSNLHHETAVHHLFFLQEVEPNNYQKLTQRLNGIDTAGKLGKADYFVKDLPFMFKDWIEYRDYLLEHLAREDKKDIFRRQFKHIDEKFSCCISMDKICKAEIQSILCNDFTGTKLKNVENSWNLNLRDYRREQERNARIGQPI